jgi:U2 small nuclear ribonucleoprotein B''
MPDEYLPPNKILFVQQLPDDTTKEGLEALFRPCVSPPFLSFSPLFLFLRLPSFLSPSFAPLTQLSLHSYANLIEVRTIPGRRNIAFVEFADEHSSSVARDALHNSKFSGTTGASSEEGLKIKVTFAKKG